MAKAFKIFFILFSFNLLFLFKAFAGIEPYVNFIKGNIKKNDTLSVKDEKFKNPLFNWGDISNISVKNSISLRVIDEKTIQKDFSCKMVFKIEYFSSPTQTEPTVIDSASIRINYKKNAGASYEGLGVYNFINGYYVKIKVIDIQSPEYGDQLPAVLQLSNDIIIDRKYVFKPYLFVGVNAEISRGGKQLRSVSNDGKQLSLMWPAIQGAEEYDIEWVNIDEGSEYESVANSLLGTSSTSLSKEEIGKIFKNNATRITTEKNSYIISLVYNSKLIAVRIRQVQYDTDGIRLEGDWFYTQDNSNVFAVWELPVWHQSNLNWQYSASYAENGKKKEVISYFDGTLRNRQTVTVNNSDDVAVVQENIYDQFGRAVASILPAPIKENTTYPQALHYFSGFNKNNSNTSYNFNDLNTLNCESFPNPLNVNSGASFYYSNNFSSSQIYPNWKFNKYIPDAEGYPISVTQYTDDNTGRIKSQGGVGPNFQPKNSGISRTTKYYYGKPEQWELDRLFGNEVGYAEHYLKNMVVDPNGQISISYLNAGGKTIATALTGKSPENVNSLSNYANEKLQTSKLLKADQFLFDASSLKLSATTTYLASVTGTDTLKYSIEKLISRYPGTNFQPCSNCYYDLKIIVKDNCGESIFDKENVVKIGSDTANKNDEGIFDASLIVDFKQIGTYFITLEFQLSNKVIEHFTEEFISLGKANGSLKKKDAFILKQFSEASDTFKDCFSDCKTALDKLGTKSDFMMMFNAKMAELGENSPLLTAFGDQLYDQLHISASQLKTNCELNYSPCDIYRTQMIADVSPQGQYARYDSKIPIESLDVQFTGLIEQEINVLTYFKNGAFNNLPKTDERYKNTLVTKDDGSGVFSPYDNQFKLSDLIKYWKSEWANEFLLFHPEFCKLQFCENNAAYAIWNEKVKNINKVADIPILLEGSQYDKNSITWLVNKDPFFNNTGLANIYKDSIIKDLNLYSQRVLNQNLLSSKNIYQYIDFQLYCANVKASTNSNINQNNWDYCQPENDCRVIDKEWQLFKDSYLELRESYYNKLRGTACTGTCEIGKPISIPINERLVEELNNCISLNGFIEITPNQFKSNEGAGPFELIHTFVQGNANTLPDVGLYCTGEIYSTVFRNCIEVSTDSKKSRFYNVWEIICKKPIYAQNCTGNAGYLIADENNGNDSYSIYNTNSIDNYSVIQGTSDFMPLSFCNSETSPVFYQCFKVYYNGTEFVYNSVWVSVCTLLFNPNPVPCGINLSQGMQSAIVANTEQQIGNIAIQNDSTSGNGVDTPITPQPPCKFYIQLAENKQASTNIVNDVKSQSIYSIRSISNSQTSGQTDSNFGNYNLYETFTVERNNGYVTTYKNVEVAKLNAEEGSYLSQTNKSVVIVPPVSHLQMEFCSENGVMLNGKFGSFTQGIGTLITVTIASGTTINQDSAIVVPVYRKREMGASVDFLGTVTVPAGAKLAQAFFEGDGNTSDAYFKCLPGTYIKVIDEFYKEDYNYNGYQCSQYPRRINRVKVEIVDEYGRPKIATNKISIGVTIAEYSNNQIYGAGGPPDPNLPTENPANPSTMYITHEVIIPVGQNSNYIEYTSQAYGATGYNGQSCGPINAWVSCVTKIFGAIYSGHDFPYCPSNGSPVDPITPLEPEKCPVSLSTKKSVFLNINTNSILPTDTVYYDRETTEKINKQIQSSAEGLAMQWREQLAEGLKNYNQEQADYLIEKLKELSIAGSDMDHPFGSSTLPLGKTIDVKGISCKNFGEVMKAALGLSNFTKDLNPWILDAPYPYESKVKANDVIISFTTQEICDKLTSLNTGNWNADDFYTHLKTTYGDGMSLSLEEFKILLKGCINCKFLLEQDLKLPMFLQPSSKGCISRSEFQQAKSALNGLFNENPDPTWANYDIILTNYYNFKWGFALPLAKYEEFDQNSNTLLCNEPLYTTITEDPYACVKNILNLFYGYADIEYNNYINLEKEKFVNAYVNVCASAKAEVNLSSKQQIYHYTLYYYDLAGNLIRTVPPEGVTFLSDYEMSLAKGARENESQVCNYNGPSSGSDENVALLSLSNTLRGSTNNAVEMWLYGANGGSRQFISATPDMKQMMQVCINGDLINVDIFTLQQTQPDNVSIILSNHVTARIKDLLPLSPWTHVVVQGEDLSKKELQIWVNGKQYTTIVNAPPAGCSWQIAGNPIVMPRNFSNLKHLRLYNNRLMTKAEIEFNAKNSCFAVINPVGIPWYRFNEPVVGSETTIAENSKVETQYKGVYPEHHLATTYVYNSTNQVIKQNTPDAGISKFWYDYLSRLIISQNAKQLASNDFSYTSYDDLGRIVEVGQKRIGLSELVEPTYLNNSFYRSFLNQGTNTQITQTFYDEQPHTAGTPLNLNLVNLRKRVAASIYRETPQSNNINATYYSYDISGNVKTLYQQIDGLGIKRLDYEYDLISGKVNFLAYQHGANDQFYYQYGYDAENRLIEAASSTVANVVSYGIGSKLYEPYKKVDATYQYYLHGPLARMELGNTYNKVQGVDYVYTLQGWLKGVNGTGLNDPGKDVGEDGNNGVAKDALAYSLGYYNGDYNPIGGGAAFANTYSGLNSDLTGRPLFNGNISSSTYAIAKINNGATVGYSYGYDQLNRIKNVRQHDIGPGNWNFSSAGDKFKESFTYDGNGNILALQRNSHSSSLMDNLSYTYNLDGAGKLINNRLTAVSDAAGVNSGNDIGSSSYTYDEIGNLKTDAAEGISNIEWSVYGKIKNIAKNSGNISYAYDPSGNRVIKTLNGLNTYYVRDAQGNSLAVYDNAGNTSNWREQQLYGSSRLGMWKPNLNLATGKGSSIWNNYGLKFFELNNHLGNVMAVISDNRLQTGNTYEADVINSNDYYAFGGQMAGRDFVNTGAQAYRYGFNGKENDNEIKGEGNQQDYGMRIYDPRVGRFLSVDPITSKYPELTPYQFGSNRPIDGIDQDGLEWYPVMKKDPKTGSYVPDNKATLDMMHAQNDAIASFFRGGAKFVIAGIAGILEIPLQVHQTGMSEPAKQAAFPMTYGQNFGTLSLGLVETPIKSIGDVIYYPEDAENWGRLAATIIAFRSPLKESTSIFRFEANVRGFAYEKMKGGNLPNNFPTIDKLYGSEVTSIKTIDLKAKSYKSGSLLYNTLKKYVDVLEKFESGQAGGKSVTPMDYTSKSLDVGYQSGTATKSQLKIFDQIKKYGKEKNIDVEFNKVK